MDIEKALYSRHSCRSFANKKVRWDKVIEAIDAAIHAPFAGNQNNLKFIIVEDQERKNIIATHAQQDFIADAPMVVIVCSDEAMLERSYDERGKIYSRQQAGAAIQNFLLRITSLGYASCWVGAYADELLKQALKIPEHIHVEAVLPVGIARDKPKPVKKHGLENVMFWGEWGVSRRPTLFKEDKVTAIPSTT